MRRDLVRAVCVLGVTLAAALPATVGAASPQVEIRSGRACGAAAYCISPSVLTVPAGATVLWHNLTSSPLLISRCSLATCPGLGPGTGPDAGPPSPSL
ncbi:MAG: cupredoxin domain-containing protein, partial [Candidatus Dormibacteria bacterium]